MLYPTFGHPDSYGASYLSRYCYPSEYYSDGEPTRGSFLLSIVCNNASKSGTVHADSTWGWTKLTEISYDTMRVAIFVKPFAIGLDEYLDRLKVDFGVGASIYSTGLTYALKGADDITVASATGESTAPNSPSLDMGLSEHHKWFSIASAQTSTYTGATRPSGYTLPDLIHGTLGTYTGMCTLASYKDAETDIEDPGAFANFANVKWIALTIGVSPRNLVVPKSLKITTKIAKPSVSNKLYGIQTWNAAGDITLDALQNYSIPIYECEAAIDESDSILLDELDGVPTISMAYPIESSADAGEKAAHLVWRTGNTINWMPGDCGGDLTACASIIRVLGIG